MNYKANNFNYISGFYDSLGFLVFGNSLKNSQLHFLSKIPPNSKVLVVGGGTGWFLEELLKTNSIKEVLYIESSSEMMRLSQKRVEGNNHETEIKFINSPLEKISLQEKFDVIITNYFLDLFNEEQLKIIVPKLYSHLNTNGLWLISDFKISPKTFHKAWQRCLLKIMYLFFRITSGVEATHLSDFHILLEELKLKKINSEEFFYGMMESVVYEKRKDWKD